MITSPCFQTNKQTLCALWSMVLVFWVLFGSLATKNSETWTKSQPLFPPPYNVTRHYYVSADHGDDSNNGSQTHPFRTIQKCAQLSQAEKSGSECNIMPGIYREEVVLSPSQDLNKTEPSIFKKWDPTGGGKSTVISGLDLIPKSNVWSLYKGNIYKTTLSQVQTQSLDFDIEQLFVDETMMIEARWPNAGSPTNDFPMNMLDPNKWQNTSEGSKYGTVMDPALAEFNFSWDGALATLNVAHQVD